MTQRTLCDRCGAEVLRLSKDQDGPQGKLRRCSVFWENAEDLESEILSHDARYIRAIAVIHEGNLREVYTTAWAMDRQEIKRCIELWAGRNRLVIDELSEMADIEKFIVVDRDHHISLLE